VKTLLLKTAALALALLCCCSAALAITTVQPAENFYAGDFAGLLDGELEQYILSQNQALEAECGAQIVVVTIDLLRGVPLEEYAYTLFNSWGIGAAQDNGLLLLISAGEETYIALQSPGLRSRFSTDRIEFILYTYFEPYFAAGRYNEGVRAAFDALYTEMRTVHGLPVENPVPQSTSAASASPAPTPAPEEDNTSPGGILAVLDSPLGFLFLIPLGILIAIIVLIINMKRSASGGRHQAQSASPQPDLYAPDKKPAERIERTTARGRSPGRKK